MPRGQSNSRIQCSYVYCIGQTNVAGLLNLEIPVAVWSCVIPLNAKLQWFGKFHAVFLLNWQQLWEPSGNSDWVSWMWGVSHIKPPPSPTPSKIPQKSSLELNPEKRRHFNLQPKNQIFACLHNSLWVLNNSKHSYQVTISQLPQWYRYFTIESKIETISSTSLTLRLLGSGTIVYFLLWVHSLVEVTPH